jgi:hypothetical protein
MARQHNFYYGQFLPWLRKKLPSFWQIRTGNSSVQGGGHSHLYCKPLKTLEKTDAVWFDDLSKRCPKEWEWVSTQVRLQGGPSLLQLFLPGGAIGYPAQTRLILL